MSTLVKQYLQSLGSLRDSLINKTQENQRTINCKLVLAPFEANFIRARAYRQNQRLSRQVEALNFAIRNLK